MANEPKHEAPFDGGSQPVTEHPPEMPTVGRSVMQWVVMIVAALVVLAAVLYVMGRAGAG